MNLRSSVETELVRQGFDLDIVSKWLGNSPDVARKHYLQITPDDIAKASAMGGKKKSADSPQHSEAEGSENRFFPGFKSAETRGKAEKYTRQESNLQPSGQKKGDAALRPFLARHCHAARRTQPKRGT